MRYIIYGAGGVGGVIGGRLVQAGHDVVLIARGAHLDAIQKQGLRLVTPEQSVQLSMTAVSHPSEIDFRDGDVVVLTMKTQDTDAALRDLEAAGGTELPVICCQNGVENERLAARRYERVYGMVVFLWATFLEPGQVIGNTTPYSGVLDAGCYPTGLDDLITSVCSDFSAAGFLSRPRTEIMAFKYAKMLGNLGTAIPAITGDPIGSPQQRRIGSALREEALACYRAAGISIVDEDQLQREVSSQYRRVAVEGYPNAEGSTWQSIARGRDSVESDYLNGEIVLLGHLHSVPTPVNAAVRRLANQVAAGRIKTGAHTVEDIEAMARAESPV
jgi:2-dehydropantoate 2-reductase